MSRQRRRAGRARPAAPRAAALSTAVGGGAGSAPTSPPTAARLLLFRAAVFATPWAALLALELLLRVAGFGVPGSFVLRRDVAGEPRLLSNPHFSWLFFDPAVARVPPPFSLAARKPPHTVRLFVLGSSAAQGDPEPAFGIARMLEVLLRDQHPGVEFEVTNAAATAVNSHYVYRAARECLRLEPDVLVLYTGNNEVVGPFGAGTVLTAEAPPLWLARASVALRASRVGQLVGGAVRTGARALGGTRAPGGWHGMEMFLDRQVRASDPSLERTRHAFERNLSDTCRLARAAGVPIVLSTVAVNLRSCGPFASLHRASIKKPERARFDGLLARARQLSSGGGCAEALEPLQQAAGIDPEHAEALFRLGRCEASLGRLPEARGHLERARDADALRFRADSRTNAIIRDVARRESEARLVDAERLFLDETPGGAPGAEDFLDHVHPTFHGNYRLALALYGAVRDSLPRWARAGRAQRPLPSEQQVAERLVYTELDRYLIDETMQQRLRDAPFTNQPDHGEHVARFADELALLRSHADSGAVEAAVAAYEKALAGGHAHWSLRERYAVVEKRLGNIGVAISQWQRLAAELPQYPSFQLQLSRALREGGRFDEARQALQKVLEYQPDAPVTLVELARLELARGRSEDAVRAARRAVALDPREANGLNVLAASLCPGRRCAPAARAEAVSLLERALAAAPESETIRRDLAALREASR